MIGDIGTVLRKEIRELLLQRGTVRGTLLSTALPFAFLGVYLAWQMGEAFLKSPILVVVWAWIPVLSVAMAVADTFAGERERHTLETLLASRLPDAAILLGKLGAVIVYSVGQAGIGVVTGLVTMLLTHWHGRPLLPLLLFTLAALGVCLVTASLSASAGVLISLRSGTVRQAAQTLSFVMMAPVLIVAALPTLPKAWRETLAARMSGLSVTAAVLIVLALMLLLSIALTGVALARFRRHQLILD